MCCILKVRWRGASARLITRKYSEYKMYLTGNNLGLSDVTLLVAGMWINKIFDVNLRQINHDKTANW